VRFAGTHCIALAALLTFASSPGWAQENSSGAATASSEAPPVMPIRAVAVSKTPSLQSPSDVEGSWVEDAPPAQLAPQQAPPFYGAPMMAPPAAPPMYDENAEKAAYLYGGYPEQYSGINFSGDPYAGYGGGEPAGYEGECCGGCSQGEHCGKCGCCASDGPCGYLWNEVHSHKRFYMREEYLYWTAKGNPLPPLVTTSSDPNIPQEFAGVLGEPETVILFGNDRVNTDWRSGGRINFGMWLVDGEFLGLEGHYFGLEQSDHRYFTDSPDILARPFTNIEEVMGVVTETPDSSLLTFPNFVNSDGDVVDLNGQIRITSKSNVNSAGLLLRKLMWIEFTQNWRLDGVAGYRFFRMNDGVMINDFWTETGGQLGTASFTSYDYFQAGNQFHGGELGLIGSVYRGPWSLELTGKIALGNVHQTMKIDGTSFVSAGGSPFVETGAFRLLTQPTNDGRYKRDVFAVLPETSLNLRFDVTKHIRLIGGYNFMWLSQAQRSGKAINLNVNTSQLSGALVGPAQPSFHFKNDNGYYLHGVSAGIEARW
jgi:hypothetical protein